MSARTVLTMMKDEAPFLLDWIAYHRIIGFERIVVFTNDCADGTEAMLDRLAEMGEVVHRPNPVPPGGKPQPLALRRAMDLPEITQSAWLIVLDVDEYLHIKAGSGRLDDLLATAPEADGFALTWRMMGSAGRRDWTDAPVIEAYPWGAPDLFRRGWGVKTLFQPFARMKLGIHRPTVKGQDKAALGARRWVNGSGKPMTSGFMAGAWRSSLATLGYAHAEIAHFATQSQEGYLKRAARGNVNAKPDKYDETYFGIFDRNEEAHGGLSATAEAVRARVAGYLADAKLAALHDQARAWHDRALAAMRAAPDHTTRLDALSAAASIPLERLDEVVFTQPLAKAGKAMVAQMRAEGAPESHIARAVAEAVAKLEAARDAADAAELRARGIEPDYGALL